MMVPSSLVTLSASVYGFKMISVKSSRIFFRSHKYNWNKSILILLNGYRCIDKCDYITPGPTCNVMYPPQMGPKFSCELVNG